MIVKEMRAIFESYGIGIDIRHMWLLADTMTYRGEVRGRLKLLCQPMSAQTNLTCALLLDLKLTLNLGLCVSGTGHHQVWY